MNITDERILEVLEERDVHTPKELANSGFLQHKRSYLNQRLIKLRKSNLVEMVGNGGYRISAKGSEYLSGDADLRDEEKPD